VTWITEALNFLAESPWALVLTVAGLLAFSETAIGFGFVVPGETGVLLMATTVTSTSRFLMMSLVVWLSAAAGDSFGYWMGRRYGVRLRDTRLVARVGRRHWDRTAEMLDRYGVAAVLVARFLPGVRVLTPASAGTFRLSYPRFLVASLSGALVWAVAHVAVGAFAGASVKYIESIIGTAGWVVLGILAAVAVVVTLRRRRRRRVAAMVEDASATDELFAR
jgi:membrane-associated protein